MKKIRQGLIGQALSKYIIGAAMVGLMLFLPAGTFHYWNAWVLMAALQRTEAGALHAYAGRPKETTINDNPWYITLCTAPESTVSAAIEIEDSVPVPTEALSEIQKGLSYQYPYAAATDTPSKKTATEQKGREKDLEASEHTPQPPSVIRKWRRPAFIAPQFSAREYGNAMHAVMQYISFENCTDAAGIRGEIDRLVQSGFLTPEQAAAVDAGKLYRFFSSKIGVKLRGGIACLREFKFSILVDGSRYDSALREERILLQGVVDCALLEEDGITVIDFKTDYVTEETLQEVISRYRGQVETYADALERIYEQPVKARYLYLFHLDRLISV